MPDDSVSHSNDDPAERQSEELAAPQSKPPSQQIDLPPGLELPESMVVSGLHMERHHSGPLPPPDMLAAYGEVDSTLPGRIVAMAESSLSHRQKMERMEQDRFNRIERGNRRERGWGQAIAAVITLVCVTSTVILALNDHDGVAGVLGGSTVVTLAGVFIAGKVIRRRQREADESNPEIE